MNIEKVVNVSNKGVGGGDHAARGRPATTNTTDPCRTNVHEVHNVHITSPPQASSSNAATLFVELAALLAAGYLRLLDARNALQAGRNPLDSPFKESDELSEPRAAGGRRA